MFNGLNVKPFIVSQSEQDTLILRRFVFPVVDILGKLTWRAMVHVPASRQPPLPHPPTARALTALLARFVGPMTSRTVMHAKPSAGILLLMMKKVLFSIITVLRA